MKNVCKFASSMHRRIDMGFEIYPNIIASSFTNQAVNSQKRKKKPSHKTCASNSSFSTLGSLTVLSFIIICHCFIVNHEHLGRN